MSIENRDHPGGHVPKKPVKKPVKKHWETWRIKTLEEFEASGVLSSALVEVK